MKKRLREEAKAQRRAAKERHRERGETAIWWQQNIAAAPKLDLTGKDINRCSGGDPVVIPQCPPDSHRDFSIGPCWQKVCRLAEDGVTKEWLKPHIRCICGAWSGIGLHHVHADGTVTASFFHATKEQLRARNELDKFVPGCGWHVFLKLDGYGDYGDYPPEPRP